MNIFLAVALKPGVDPQTILNADTERFLPKAATSREHWLSHSKRIVFISYQIGPIHHGLIQSDADLAASMMDGILLSRPSGAGTHANSWPFGHLRTLKEHAGFQGEGEFTAAWTPDGERLLCRANLGGSHNLYVTQTDAFIAISNRSTPLLGLPGVSSEPDLDGMRWKAFHGYIGGMSTAFAAIRKIRNGSHVLITDGKLTIEEATYQHTLKASVIDTFATNPTLAFNNEIDRIADYMRRAFTATGSTEIDVSLSGGKDSRVILALLLHAGLKDSISSIWTRGALYSPEVLAASDICKVIAYPHHEVRRPPQSSHSMVNARSILSILSNQEGMLSLFDFCGIGHWKPLRFQGHELGLRAGRFARCDTSSAEAFVRTAISVWSNPLQVLRTPSYVTGQLEELFWNFYRQGAPADDLGDLYSLFDRLPSWAAVISSTEYSSGPISNPLLAGDVIRFALSIPAAFRRSEVFHYMALAHAAPDLLDVPFAEQVWPKTLDATLASAGITRIGTMPPPYRSSPHFPNIRNPYINNIKLDYFNCLKPVICDLLNKHADYFDPILDIQKFIEQQEREVDPGFVYLYSSLGVYSAVLLKEYGVCIFDRQQRAAADEDLQARIRHHLPDHPADNDSATSSKEGMYEASIERHERAIAGFVRQLQQTQIQSADATPV